MAAPYKKVITCLIPRTFISFIFYFLFLEPLFRLYMFRSGTILTASCAALS